MKTLVFALMCWLTPLAVLAAPVNINTASVEEIDAELKGVGPVLAERIVSYRNAHGPFRRPEDIQKVPYVGVKTFQKNRHQILVE